MSPIEQKNVSIIRASLKLFKERFVRRGLKLLKEVVREFSIAGKIQSHRRFVNFGIGQPTVIRLRPHSCTKVIEFFDAHVSSHCIRRHAEFSSSPSHLHYRKFVHVRPAQSGVLHFEYRQLMFRKCNREVSVLCELMKDPLHCRTERIDIVCITTMCTTRPTFNNQILVAICV